MSVLVVADHDNAELKPVTLVVMAAAAAIGGDVDLLVAGEGCGAVAEAAAKIPGVSKVLLADNAAYGHQLAENIAPLVAELGAGYSHILTAHTIRKLKANIVAGAANNQLATEEDGARLADRDILYAPDYVINAGGIINVAREYYGGSSEEEVRAEIGRIPGRLEEIFQEAKTSKQPTNLIADEMARRLVAGSGSQSPVAA